MKRKCLKCGETFEATGKFNRICFRCSNTGKREAYALYGYRQSLIGRYRIPVLPDGGPSLN